MIEDAIESLALMLMAFSWGCIFATNREVNTGLIFFLSFIGLVVAIVIRYRKRNRNLQ